MGVDVTLWVTNEQQALTSTELLSGDIPTHHLGADREELRAELLQAERVFVIGEPDIDLLRWMNNECGIAIAWLTTMADEECVPYVQTVLSVNDSEPETWLSSARDLVDRGVSEVALITESGGIVYEQGSNEALEIPPMTTEHVGSIETFAGVFVADCLLSDNIHHAVRMAVAAHRLQAAYEGLLRETAEEIDRDLRERDEAENIS